MKPNDTTISIGGVIIALIIVVIVVANVLNIRMKKHKCNCHNDFKRCKKHRQSTEFKHKDFYNKDLKKINKW